jgi:selenocysteine-specific elongation factor
MRMELLADAPHTLDEGDEVEVHGLASRIPARIDRLSQRPLSPGSTAVAQLQLRSAMLLFPGDRVVLRRPAPVNTFAGGKVLDTHLGRLRRRHSADLERLPAPERQAWPQLLSSWISSAGLNPPSVEDLAGRLGLLPDALEAPIGRLLEGDQLHVLPTQPRRFVTKEHLKELGRSAAAELEQRLAHEEVSAGVPARDFVASLLPRSALSLATIYLDELRRRGIVELSEGRVVPPGRAQHMTAVGEELTARIEALYRESGLEPPSPSQVAEQLSARPVTVEGICKFLVTRGHLVRLEGKYLIHRAVLDEIARQVHDWEVTDFGVGEFKDKFDLTRKLAIPILEWLDSERVTLRQGNRRKVLKRRAGG